MEQNNLSKFDEKRLNKFVKKNNILLFRGCNSNLTRLSSKWVIYCEAHNKHHVLKSRRTSVYFMANPQVWCADCRILSSELLDNRFARIRKVCSLTMEEVLKTFDMFCPVCGKKMTYCTFNQRNEYFYSCGSCGERDKIRFEELPGIDKLEPGDFEYCPKCRGSFSFAKPKENGECPWCNKNILSETG